MIHSFVNNLITSFENEIEETKRHSKLLKTRPSIAHRLRYLLGMPKRRLKRRKRVVTLSSLIPKHLPNSTELHMLLECICSIASTTNEPLKF